MIIYVLKNKDTGEALMSSEKRERAEALQDSLARNGVMFTVIETVSLVTQYPDKQEQLKEKGWL